NPTQLAHGCVCRFAKRRTQLIAYGAEFRRGMFDDAYAHHAGSLALTILFVNPLQKERQHEMNAVISIPFENRSMGSWRRLQSTIVSVRWKLQVLETV